MSGPAIQVALATLSIFGLFLNYRCRPSVRRWAPVVGLATQPFWMAFGVETNAIGVMIVALVYAGVHGYGFHQLWIARDD